MAIVTLKDLMDPLSKIEAAAQQTNEKLDAIVAVTVGASQNGVAIIDELQKQTMLLSELVRTNQEIDAQTGASITKSTIQLLSLRKILKAIQKGNKDDKSSSKASSTGGPGNKVEKAGELLQMLGVGSLKTAKGMMLWALVPAKGVTKFTEFIKSTFEKLAETDTKKAKEGIEALDLMGGAILKFSKALAISALLIIPGMIAIPFLAVSILAMGGIMSLLGSPKFNKRIKAGGESVDIMGDAIKKFAIGLALFSLVAPLAVITAPLMAVSMLLIGGVVSLLGSPKFSKRIRAGSTSLSRMGNALIKFTVGLVVLALATAVIASNPILIALMAGSIALIGGAVALLGGKKMSKRVRAGTRNLGLLGLGIALFGLGYGFFAKAFPEKATFKQVLVQAAAIAGIGGAVGLIGKFKVKTMASGAAALGLIGLALPIFTKGYKPYAAVTKGMSVEDVGIQVAALFGIGLATVLIGKFGIKNIAQGALSFALTGIALTIFNYGYIPFALATEGMSLEDVGMQLAILGGIGTVMSVAGIAVAASGGSAMLGPALFAAAGGALLALAPGLEKMRDLDYTKKDGIALATTLGAVAMAFAGTAPSEGEEGGLWSGIKGAFSRVGESGAGLAAAAMYAAAGLALQELAEGLSAFSKINFTKKESEKLGLALGTITAAFAQAGGEAADPGGALGAVFGNTFSSNAVEKGIDSVMDAGEALTNIATGLNAFTGIKDPEGLATKIKGVVGMVGEAFAAVGGAEDKDGGSFLGFTWDENIIEKGIDAVDGAGDALAQIAKGLNSFAGVKDPKLVAKKVSDTLTLIGGAFMSIGGKKEEDSALFGLISWDENAVNEGIEAVDGAGEALLDIAESLVKFEGLKNPEKVAEGIKKIFTSIGDTFIHFYSQDNFSRDVDHMKGFISQLAEAAGSGELATAATDLDNIAAAINSVDIYKAEALGNLFKGASDLGNNRSAYEDLQGAVEEIRDLLSESTGGTTTGGTTTGGTGETGNTNMNSAFRKLTGTLSRMESTLSSLPNEIRAIKLELPED
jgi:hypothetical protein